MVIVEAEGEAWSVLDHVLYAVAVWDDGAGVGALVFARWVVGICAIAVVYLYLG